MLGDSYEARGKAYMEEKAERLEERYGGRERNDEFRNKILRTKKRTKEGKNSVT
jgi:hypothetical protein